MTPSVQSSSSAAAATGAGQNSSAASAGTQITKTMFLELLVAQLKNQDPLNPASGVEFLTQLAQFQQLEQAINMGEDLKAIRQNLDKLVAAGQSETTTTTT
jgi:flagellar basal-body rod modification protein FlgD